MKILHVCQNYFPSVGGPQYTMKHLSEKFVALYNDKVEVCTTNSLYNPESKLFQRIDPAWELVENVAVTRLPFIRWHYPLLEFSNKVHAKFTGRLLPYSITKKRWALDSPAINKMMSETNADVIMATTIIYNFADYPTWRSKIRNSKPFVLYGALHLHQELPENSPFISRAKNCDCYISNTEFERKELIKMGVDANKVVTIGTGIEPKDFICNETAVKDFKIKYGINDDEIVIGYIGRLVKGKGVALLLESFRKIYPCNKKVRLLLAGGTTEYVPFIRQIIEQEKLPIVLIENFEENFKPVLYHALDVFVLASQSESFGVVFLEAWACKKPVIGTRMGAIASLLTEGSDSLLFTAGDVDDLSKQIQLLIENKELRNEFGRNGFDKVVKNYTWPVIVKRYRDAYLMAIENFKYGQSNLARRYNEDYSH